MSQAGTNPPQKREEGRCALLGQFIVASETVSWERFYHYLVAISLLGIAWATVYTSNCGIHRELILACFGVAGALLSFLWYGMGVRSRRYLDMYRELAVRAEIGDAAYKKLHEWREDPNKCVGNTNNKRIYEQIGCQHEVFPFSDTWIRAARLSKTPIARITSSTVLLRSVPLCFFGLFVFLTYASEAGKGLYLPVFLAVFLEVRYMWGVKPDPMSQLERP